MTSRSTIATATEVIAPTVAGISRTRATIVAAMLAVGSAAVAVFFLWSPGPNRDDFTYASIAPVRQASFVGYLIDSVGFGLAAVGLAVAMCLLVRARGAACANIGAILTTVGGILVAISSFALACLRWYATSTKAISADSGTALLAISNTTRRPSPDRRSPASSRSMWASCCSSSPSGDRARYPAGCRSR